MIYVRKAAKCKQWSPFSVSVIGSAVFEISRFTCFTTTTLTIFICRRKPTSLVVLVDVETWGMMVRPTVVPAIRSDTAQASV